MVKLLQAPSAGGRPGRAAGHARRRAVRAGHAGQAITVEARTLAHPVSYELASSVKGEGIGTGHDGAAVGPPPGHMVSLCPGRGHELVVAAQAIDLDVGQGRGTGRVYRLVRELVPFTQADGTLPADLEPLVELISRGDLP